MSLDPDAVVLRIQRELNARIQVFDFMHSRFEDCLPQLDIGERVSANGSMKVTARICGKSPHPVR